MTVAPIELPPDEPPKSGVWVDVHDVLANPTPEEVAEGLRQGQEVDTGDDRDNGLPFAHPLGLIATVGQSTALTKAQALKARLLAHGVPEVSIELVIGRPQSLSASNWDALWIHTNFGHHTVSNYSTSRLTPCLSLVKVGRSDLAGPLCNGYGGWDLCARIICFGYANHPGAGGPFTIDGYTIPKDSARRYAFGWEFEGGINAADWARVLTNPRTGDKMTFHEFMARCGAGTQDYFKLSHDAHLEHKTWAPGRKNDRINYTRESGIALINKYRGTNAPTPPPPPPPAPEDSSMSAQDVSDLKAWIGSYVSGLVNVDKNGTLGVWNRNATLRDQAMLGKLDELAAGNQAIVAAIQENTTAVSRLAAAVEATIPKASA